MMRCITAICPAGPPKESAATRSHTRNASPSETPCAGRGRVPAETEISVMGSLPYFASFPRKRRAVRGTEDGCAGGFHNHHRYPLAGLVPAIHVFSHCEAGSGKDVDGRDKPGQGGFFVALSVAPQARSRGFQLWVCSWQLRHHA